MREGPTVRVTTLSLFMTTGVALIFEANGHYISGQSGSRINGAPRVPHDSLRSEKFGHQLVSSSPKTCSEWPFAEITYMFFSDARWYFFCFFRESSKGG